MQKAYKSGIKEGWISGLGNIFLFAIKLWAGIVSGSVALVADAWHTLTDTISSVVIIVGIKIASKPPDKEHPFGHGRAEMLASIIVGFMLVLVGIHFVQNSVEKILNHNKAYFGTLAIIVTAVSVIVKELMARYALKIARKTKVESVKADGWHHRSDAISSMIILIGIFFEKRIWWIDAALGIMVSIIIFYSAYNILKTSIDILLGSEPEAEIIEKIKNIASGITKENLRLHHFHIHTYGFHKEMTFHIVLPGEMKLNEARDITQVLFEKVKEELNILATIHIDTQSKY